MQFQWDGGQRCMHCLIDSLAEVSDKSHNVVSNLCVHVFWLCVFMFVGYVFFNVCVWLFYDTPESMIFLQEIHTLSPLEMFLDPVALPVSIFPCNLQYLVTPTLKNTQ